MQRMIRLVALKPGRAKEVLTLYKNCWPEVLDALDQANIRNFTIYAQREANLLVSYWEYHGSDYERDYRALSVQPSMNRWDAICRSSLAEVPGFNNGSDLWAPTELIYAQDRV